MRAEKNVPCFPCASIILSGVVCPFLMVVLLLHSEELPALDLSLTSLCTMFGFLVLVYKCKAPPPLNNTVMFISLVLYLLFLRQGVVLFSSILCLFLYWLWWHVFASFLLPPPPFFQCVLISNVCGFADGFMKKRTKKETAKDSAVFRDGWWLVWLVITIASFWHEYVCKDTKVHCGRWEHFKIEK